jgi:hypothetical protein
MRTNLTPQDVTPELKRAVAVYVVRRQTAEIIRKKVDEVERKVLRTVALFNDLEVEHGLEQKRITDPKQVYLSQDEGSLEYYYEAVDMNLRQAGIKPIGMPFDHCPALVAEHERTKAEWDLLDEAAKMLDAYEEPGQFNNDLLCAGLDKRQQFIDLTVKLLEEAP